MVANPNSLLMSQITAGGYWFGTDTAFMSLFNMAMNHPVPTEADYKMYGPSSEDEQRFGGRYHYLLNKYDDIAVLDVRGPIVSYESWINRFFGMVSYEEIANAAVTASRDPNISKILLKMDSPGGTVKGVDECCNTLRLLAKNELPIYTLVSGEMNSAAYFIGSVATKIFSTALSISGSIGAVRPLISQFNMLKDMGIDVKILRSPEFKALGHPLEPMNDKAIEVHQQSTEHFAQLFEQYVAENRGTTVELVREKFGQGKTFIGQLAVDNGLVDEITTFEAVIKRLRSND